jgi:hypothetical protein
MKKRGVHRNLVIVIFILLVAFGMMFSGFLGWNLLQGKKDLRGGFTEEEVSKLAGKLDKQEAVNVNDQKITAEEVSASYNSMSEELRTNITQEDVLVSLINEKLLLQAAENEGIISPGVELDTQEKQEAIKKLLEKNVGLSNVQVPDGEIDSKLRAEFSGDIIAEDPELGAFFREKTEEKLLLEKRRQMLEDYLRRLQENAAIE